jgi:hypothetical protein
MKKTNYLARGIAIVFFIMLFSGYAFCQDINDPDKVINQKNEIQSSEEAKDVTAVTSDESKTASEPEVMHDSMTSESKDTKDVTKIASESEKTQDVTAVTSDESKTTPEHQESEGLASKIADTAEKIANATSGSSILCGVGVSNLPQAILCGAVDAINLLSNGTAYISRRISGNEFESEPKSIEDELKHKNEYKSKIENEFKNKPESKPEKNEPSWRL